VNGAKSSRDPGGDRPSRPSRHNPRNECRQLSPERSCRQGPWSQTTANARDNEDVILIFAPRQPNAPVTQISLALSSRRDNHPPAATAEMAILIVAVFPSRLSRYTASRPMQAPTSRPKASVAIPVATVEALPAKVVCHNGFSAFHQLSVTDLSTRDLRTQGTADSVAAKSRWLVALRDLVQQRRRSPYWSK
jgi:hypothetical protein